MMEEEEDVYQTTDRPLSLERRTNVEGQQSVGLQRESQQTNKTYARGSDAFSRLGCSFPFCNLWSNWNVFVFFDVCVFEVGQELLKCSRKWHKILPCTKRCHN